MKQVLAANKTIMSIIGNAKLSKSGYRFINYAVAEPIEDGILLYNTLTCELLLLTQEEYDNALQDPILRQKWFVVPEDTCEKKIAQMVRWVQKSTAKQKKGISRFVILTTTDCNARCFYCFELGCKRIPMSDGTALKTFEFIKENSLGNHVVITWFGGEPLFNTSAIDIICQKLREAGISYESKMVSNGYLFDDENVRKCTELWNLKKVQISMDGTEEIYNKTKRYIYKEGNSYQIVMSNIQRLLDSEINVIVRVNMDFHNIEDLNVFAEEMAHRFGGNSKFCLYPRLIISETKAWDESHTLDEWAALYEAKNRLEQKLNKLGIFKLQTSRLRRNLPQTACMADSSNSVVITPDGHLGTCEHYTDKELIGHIDSAERDEAVIDSFRQYWEDTEECDTCFYYPQCIRLKKCSYNKPCIGPERMERGRHIRIAMLNEYRQWVAQAQEEEIDPEDEV